MKSPLTQKFHTLALFDFSFSGCIGHVCVCVCTYMCARAFAHAHTLTYVQLSVIPWIAAHQAPLSMESWSRLPLAALALARGFPGGTVLKNPPANAGASRDTGSIPRLGRSPREGNGNPLQYSCLENPIDRGAWWATVHEVTKI